MNTKSLEALQIRIASLREACEKARILHNCLFDLHLIDEQMLSHKIMNDIDNRIDQLTNLYDRAKRKSEE